MQDPDPSLWTKLLENVWAGVLALGGIVWNMQREQIKDIRKECKDSAEANSRELDRHRDVMGKLFDKLEEHARRSEDRHRELLHALHDGLDRKVDK
jgi:hypothetical protein